MKICFVFRKYVGCVVDHLLFLEFRLLVILSSKISLFFDPNCCVFCYCFIDRHSIQQKMVCVMSPCTVVHAQHLYLPQRITMNLIMPLHRHDLINFGIDSNLGGKTMKLKKCAKYEIITIILTTQ